MNPLWIGLWYARSHMAQTRTEGRYALLVREMAKGASRRFLEHHWPGTLISPSMRAGPMCTNGVPSDALARWALQSGLDDFLRDKRTGDFLTLDDYSLIDTYSIERSHLGERLDVRLYKVSLVGDVLPGPIKGETLAVYQPTRVRLIVEEGVAEVLAAGAERKNYFRPAPISNFRITGDRRAYA